MDITLHPKKILWRLLLVAGVLVLLNGAALVLYFHYKVPIVYVLSGIFDFDIEGAIPTFFSALLLLSCSGLLAVLARRSRRDNDGRFFYWVSLSMIFCFLAVDEACRLHENLSDFFENFMKPDGLLFFLWVVPYGIATLVLGMFYLRFVWRLPPPVRRRFVFAGIVFLTGALGFEMLGAREAQAHGIENVTYCALYTIEEFLEMLGSILFLSALLTHLGPFTLRIGAASTAGES